MKSIFTINELIELFGPPVSQGNCSTTSYFEGVSIDSRTIKKGEIFIPLIGEKFDGHHFLLEAFNRGAKASILSNNNISKIPSELAYWLVEDTLRAYQQIALLYRNYLNIPVIAITGSVGKTTTRELIKGALSPLGVAHATNHNENNDVGVPLTILKANSENAAMIIEMGMRGFGEIRRLSICAKPNIAVITKIGFAHIGRLGNRRNIAKAKCEIVSGLEKDAVVIIPANDYLLEEALKSCWKGRVVRVGLETLGNREGGQRPNDDKIDLIGRYDEESEQIEFNNSIFHLPLEGKHNALNFMLALAVAKELNVDLLKIRQIEVKQMNGRNNQYIYGGITILDETYNSSPDSVMASLDLLVKKKGRHFAVLGSMLELGTFSANLHNEVAGLAVKLSLDGLIFVSRKIESKHFIKLANKLPYFQIVSTPDDAIHYLEKWLIKGDVVLLKASRACNLERLLPLIKKAFNS